VVREKHVWPAFEHSSSSIGTKGFRSTGWHERRERESARDERPAKKKASQAAAAGDAALPADLKAHGIDLAPSWPPVVIPTPLVYASPAPGLYSVPTIAVPPPVEWGHLDDQVALIAVMRALRDTCYPGAQPRAPTLESALTSLSAFEARHPGMPAVVINLCATLPDDIFIAQNAASVHNVGLVSRAFRGTYRHLLPHVLVGVLFKAIVLCARKEGRESVLQACKLLGDNRLLNLVVAVDGAVAIVGAVGF